MNKFSVPNVWLCPITTCVENDVGADGELDSTGTSIALNVTIARLAARKVALVCGQLARPKELRPYP